MLPNIQNAHDSAARNIINATINSTNAQGKAIQDLVAKGQLTPEQYATLIQSVNGLISKGDVSVDDINMNLGKIGLSHLSEEVKTAMTGNTPILSEVADDSVTNEKIVREAVTPDKTNFFSQTKNLADGNYRSISMKIISSDMLYDYNTGIASTSNTQVVPIKPNKTYTIKVYSEHDVLRIGVNNSSISISGNQNKLDRNLLNTRSSSEFTFTNNSSGRFLMVQTSESNQRPRLQVEEGSSATEYVEPFELPSGTVEGMYEIIRDISDLNTMFPSFELNFSQGSINADGNQIDSAPSRVHTEWLELEIGDVISITDERYDIAIAGLPSTFTWSNNDYTHQQNEPIRFMVRKNSSDITPEEASKAIKVLTGDSVVRKSDVSKIINENSNLNIIKYVSLNGNDGNTGDSLGTGYETLQKAVDEGASTVYMERGEYLQSFSGSAESLTILPANKSQTDPTTESVEKITFLGGHKSTGYSSFEGIYRKSINNEYPNFKEYFIDQTMDRETGGNRPQYNCIMWESRDLEMDYVMKPVLTIDEVKNETGTFHYDGDYIYINPESIDNDFYVPFENNGLDFSGTKKLKMEDVEADYFLNTPINLDEVTTVVIRNCEAKHSAYMDGFSIDNTNGKFSNCLGAKNRNDGFNLHFYGDTEFINCYGINNYDDGISHHEHCTGVVIGGVYRGNGKAGSAPVQGAKVNHYNVIFEDNDYGLLNSRAGADNISKNNVYKNNRFGISSNNTDSIITSGDKFIGNENDIISNGEVKEY